MDSWEYDLGNQSYHHKNTRRKTIIVLVIIAVILLIVLGVILGVVLGTKKDDNPPLPTETQSEVLTIAFNVGFRNQSMQQQTQDEVSSGSFKQR